MARANRCYSSFPNKSCFRSCRKMFCIWS